MSILENLIAAANAGTLTTFRLPGGGDLALSIDGTMMRQAQEGWADCPAERRRKTFESVKRAVKRGLKHHKRHGLSQKERDEWASDCALWFVHELLYADGEKYLTKGPQESDLRRVGN